MTLTSRYASIMAVVLLTGCDSDPPRSETIPLAKPRFAAVSSSATKGRIAKSSKLKKKTETVLESKPKGNFELKDRL